MITTYKVAYGIATVGVVFILQKLLEKRRDQEDDNRQHNDDQEKRDLRISLLTRECLETMTSNLVTIHEAAGDEYGQQNVIDNVISAAYKLLKVEKVTVIMIKKDNDGNPMTIGSFQVEADNSHAIAALAAVSGRTVCANNVKNDDRFRSFLPVNWECVNIICSPVKSACGEVTGVISVFNKRSDAAFTRDDESLLESIAINASVALTKSYLYEQTLREKRRYAALIPVIKARSCSATLDMILKEMVEVVGQLLETNFVSIYLVDHENQEAVICASNHGLDGYTVCFGEGTAGTAAAKGIAVRVTNTNGDVNVKLQFDKFCDVNPTTILCVPVPGFKVKTAAAAVIQTINKRDGENFDSFDEESLFMLCEELSNVLRSKAIELQELRSSTANLSRRDSTDIALLNSLLSEYGSKRYKLPSFSPSISRSSSYLTLPKSLSSSGSFRTTGLDTDAVDMMSEEEVSGYLACHDTDPFILEDMSLIHLAQHMLDSYGLVERFGLDPDKLRQFLITVHKGYRKNNSFHNFKHAWGTMHLTYQILRKGADEHLTSLDILSVLIAAICHDLDHPGNNNAFEIATRSALALTYSDDVVLERHHCSVALKILAADNTNFIERLSQSDKLRLRKVLTASIMATDMSHHFSLMAQLVMHSSRPVAFTKKDSEDRLNLTRFVLHSADIGAQTQTRNLSLKWTERCLSEFSQQGEKERALGLELTPFMQGLDDELTRMQLQMGFIGGIVIPLWSALAECFPNLSYATEQAIDTKTYYSDRVDAISEERASSSTSTRKQSLQ